MGMVIADEAGDGSQAVGAALHGLFAAPPAHLHMFYGMMSYQIGLVDAQLSSRAQPAGQPLSTQVCLRCARSLGGREAAARAGAAITLLGHWLGIHGDIEQQKTHTWVGPAVWSAWGVPQALNAGDGLLPLAVGAMLDVGSDVATALALVRELTEHALAYTNGQYLLLSMSGAENVPAGEYLRALELTSGSLTGYSAWVGAVVGGGDGQVQEKLRGFGAALGTAAAIRDQIAGATHRSGKPSRPPGRTPEGDGILTSTHLRRYLDEALAALEQAGIAGAAQRSLETFAQERCALLTTDGGSR